MTILSPIRKGIFIALTIFFASQQMAYAQTPDAQEIDNLFAEAFNLFDEDRAESNEPALSKFLTVIELLGKSNPNDERIGRGLIAAGTAAKRLGRRDQAIDLYLKGLKFFEARENVLGQAIVLNQIGLVRAFWDEPRLAIEAYNKALILAQSAGEPKTLASVLNNLGHAYELIGETEIAIDFYIRSLTPRRRAADTSGEATTLGNLGQLYASIGDHEKAISNLESAARIYRDSPDRSGVAALGLTLGKIFSDAGDHAAAVKRYESALAIFDDLGDKESIAATLNNIGYAQHDLGNFEVALVRFDRAMAFSRETEDVDGEAVALGNSMFTWLALGKRRTAIFFGKLALRKYQGIRNNLRESDRTAQLSYLRKIRRIYRVLAEILIDEKRLTEAHEVLVAFQDQDYFDGDARRVSRESISLRDGESKLFAEFDVLIGRAAAAVSNLERTARENDGRIPLAAQTMRNAAFESALSGLHAFGSRVEAELIKNEGTATNEDLYATAELRRTLGELRSATGRNPVAIQTLVGERQFRVLIVTPERIEAVSTPADEFEINSLAVQLWGLLQTPAYDTRILSKKIYDIIFRPISDRIPANTQTLMWSLDGNLRYMPVAALWDGEKFLAERFANVVFTRADRSRMTRARRDLSGVAFGASEKTTVDLYRDGRKLTFGELRGVPVELTEIFGDAKRSRTGIVKGSIHLDSEFSLESFLKSLELRPPIVHVASHFNFRPGDEKSSFLVLGNGSVLTLDELKRRRNIFDGVDLLTLSACNTSASQGNGFGREIDGFAELAQTLGAASVLATLWPVSDESTPTLTREFYDALRKSKNSTKAAALRDAQLSLLRGTAKIAIVPGARKGLSDSSSGLISLVKGRVKPTDRVARSGVVRIDIEEAPPFTEVPGAPFAHPYYWAPFVLYGNWR